MRDMQKLTTVFFPPSSPGGFETDFVFIRTAFSSQDEISSALFSEKNVLFAHFFFKDLSQLKPQNR